MIKPDLNKPVFQFMPRAKERVAAGRCPLCNREIIEGDFKDEISKKEYTISGLCQQCQNDTFKN